jgi:hypothetical protein
MRHATLITADDVNFSVTGKMNISGVYTTDINIMNDPMFVGQLVFLFVIETEPSDPFQKLELRVDLPGGDFRQLPLNIANFRMTHGDSIRWSLRYPMLFQSPILRPGPIMASVVHDQGVLFPAAPFIILRTTTPPQVPPSS